MQPSTEQIFASSSTPLVVLFLLFLFLFFKILHKTPKNLPPNPTKLPFIGNLHQIGSLPHRSLYSLSLKHGPLMFVYFGETPYLIVSSSDMAQIVLQNHDRIFSSRPSMVASDILYHGDMAFQPNNELWRQMRKMSSIHLLSSKRVNMYTKFREEEVSQMIQVIKNQSSLHKDDPIDMSKILYSLSNGIIRRVLSSYLARDEGKTVLLKELIYENVKLLGTFSIADLFPSFSWLEGILGLSSRAKRNRQKWDKLLDEVIQAHVQMRNNSDHTDIDFVDVLLSLKDDPSLGFDFKMENIRGLLLDMIAAGIDTTYTTLEWTMSELMKNPDSMKKLQNEVREIAEHSNMIKSEELNQMKYMKAVIKETLRLHPPAPLLVPKQSTRQCTINGYTIPERTKVLVNAWAIGREPKSWDAPEEFMPERFLDNRVDYLGNDFQFIPFGAGRRICPGLQFGESVLELALATLLRQFDWELPRGTTVDEFNMIETSGLTTQRKDSLRLVARSVDF